MSKPQTEPKQARKSTTRVILICLVVLAVIPVLYVAIMVLSPDGTEKYSGVKKVVARRALDFEQHNSSISPLPSFMRQLYVEEVRPITATEKTRYCYDAKTTSDDPDNPYYYVATIKIQRLFEINTQKVTEYGCVFLPVDVGSQPLDY